MIEPCRAEAVMRQIARCVGWHRRPGNGSRKRESAKARNEEATLISYFRDFVFS